MSGLHGQTKTAMELNRARRARKRAKQRRWVAFPKADHRHQFGPAEPEKRSAAFIRHCTVAGCTSYRRHWPKPDAQPIHATGIDARPLGGPPPEAPSSTDEAGRS